MAVTAEQADKNRLCTNCHDGDNSPHFEFATYYGKISHKGLDDYNDPKVHRGIAPKAGARRAQSSRRYARECQEQPMRSIRGEERSPR